MTSSSSSASSSMYSRKCRGIICSFLVLGGLLIDEVLSCSVGSKAWAQWGSGDDWREVTLSDYGVKQGQGKFWLTWTHSQGFCLDGYAYWDEGGNPDPTQVAFCQSEPWNVLHHVDRVACTAPPYGGSSSSSQGENVGMFDAVNVGMVLLILFGSLIGMAILCSCVFLVASTGVNEPDLERGQGLYQDGRKAMGSKKKYQFSPEKTMFNFLKDVTSRFRRSGRRGRYTTQEQDHQEQYGGRQRAAGRSNRLLESTFTRIANMKNRILGGRNSKGNAVEPMGEPRMSADERQASLWELAQQQHVPRSEQYRNKKESFRNSYRSRKGSYKNSKSGKVHPTYYPKTLDL